MDKPSREAEPYFSQPVRQIFLMLMVILMVSFGAYIALPALGPVFFSNLYLNGFILFVFLIGVLSCFLQVIQLIASVSWIKGFAADRKGHQFTVAPRLLAPLAALLRSRGVRMQIGSSSARSILDSVATRIDEARDITRYIVSLLIFLGLLGTFYGLATTVPAVVETIKSLAPTQGEDSMVVFGRLMTGLEKQLGGMGTAFSSSLLGLAGSLVVGLLELFAGHGQNRFYRELEEWLSTITRLGFSSGDGEGGGDQGLVAAVLDQMSHQMSQQMSQQMDALQALFAQSDVSRAKVDDQLAALANSVEQLTGRLGQPDVGLIRVAEGQEKLIALMRAQVGQDGESVDAESRMRLRSIDVQLLRILEEMASGRQETMADLRTDLAQLTKAIRQLAAPVAGRRS